ncbi:hypothetical protein GTS_18340 [Gandjariella thermophila]|uniref:Uncharacterized protein n=1 Tax=Gandjariella thermophila TaxID=1931992 RepID=A0A4D4J151_9PSEU|nr:hypothetical protein GTS_18340 [Gandjariella thermophila]
MPEHDQAAGGGHHRPPGTLEERMAPMMPHLAAARQPAAETTLARETAWG